MVVVAAAATMGHVNAQGINADLISCDASNPNQQWMYHPGSDNHIVLKHNGWCLDVEDYGTTPGKACHRSIGLGNARLGAFTHLDTCCCCSCSGSNVWTFLCHPSDKNPAHQNQAWQMKSDGNYARAEVESDTERHGDREQRARACVSEARNIAHLCTHTTCPGHRHHHLHAVWPLCVHHWWCSERHQCAAGHLHVWRRQAAVEH